MEINIKPFFCSWSGGKDSCLSLYRAIKRGAKPELLFTMFTENGIRSRSHGLHINLVQAQAKSLNIPLMIRSASWNNYEAAFIDGLNTIEKNTDLRIGVFGDIDLEDNRKWVVDTCKKTSIEPYHPIWQEDRKKLLTEFVESGFKAIIVAVKDGLMDKDFLGKILDNNLIREIEELNIDACGEEGEFHTVVTDGPIFSYPIDVELKDKVLLDGYWFIDMSLSE
ncbi:MAG: diphthine--ammonia ligase [Candidatus Gastranaerophilales bacterium]|nr:diphthine--ammonia ligase [Candidatus Gastranaerophilales bacterium]